jgi:hypothetical protein
MYIDAKCKEYTINQNVNDKRTIDEEAKFE